MAVLKLLVLASLARRETFLLFYQNTNSQVDHPSTTLVSLTMLDFVVFSQNKSISVGQTAWKLISNDWLSLVCHCFIFRTLSPPRCQ